jgi:hypothetical protein
MIKTSNIFEILVRKQLIWLLVILKYINCIYIIYIYSLYYARYKYKYKYEC